MIGEKTDGSETTMGNHESSGPRAPRCTRSVRTTFSLASFCMCGFQEFLPNGIFIYSGTWERELSWHYALPVIVTFVQVRSHLHPSTSSCPLFSRPQSEQCLSYPSKPLTTRPSGVSPCPSRPPSPPSSLISRLSSRSPLHSQSSTSMTSMT